jgi:hypothetical protein
MSRAGWTFRSRTGKKLGDIRRVEAVAVVAELAVDGDGSALLRQ